MVSSAIFVYKNAPLAEAIRDYYFARTHDLRQMSPEEVRAIGYDYLYFAYGANMDSQVIAKRAPGAQFVDVASVEDWELIFSTRGPHLSGRGASIAPASGRTVWGLVYALSHKDRASLDLAERIAYEPIEMTVHARATGSPLQVFTYVARSDNENAGVPDRQYLQRMMAVAADRQIEPLWIELQRYLEPENPSPPLSD
jgi:hypothetical protein